MARKTVLDTYYTFTPSTRTIVVNRAIPRERIALITDVTTNQVLYNFSDSTLTFSSYTIATSSDGSLTTTTMVLNYNTTNLSPSDKIQIMVDEYDEKFSPSETYVDAVDKIRVGTPQSLIDTDFEYSIQQTKWEALGLINNRPLAAFNPSVNQVAFTDLQATFGSRTYTVLTSTPLANGTPIVIADSYYAGADGMYVVDTSNATSFSYTGKYPYTGSSPSIYNSGVTIIYSTSYLSYANIPLANVANVAATSNGVLITTSQNHGLAIGNEIALVGTTQSSGSNTYNGSWVVATVPNTSTFNIYTNQVNGGTISYFSSQSGTLTSNSFAVTSLSSTTGLAVGMIVSGTGIPSAPPTYITGITSSTAITISQIPSATGSQTLTFTAGLYVRPQGTSVHRPADGGLKFSVNSPSHNGQMIRQTRRAFRYQSGKGVQISTGTVMKPNMQIDQLTSSGTTATVITKDPHNLTPSAYVTISGATYANGAPDTAYNVTNTAITGILTPYSFTYTTNGTPVSTTAAGYYTGSVVNWYGGATRVGIFNDQNGMFFEYDGQQMWAVRRHSTYRIAGEAFIQQGNNVIVANTNLTTPNWNNQIFAGDYIVIKGQSYRVLTVANSSYMTISPQYRGPTINSAQINKTIDIRIPQSQWNIDRMDGTGPSGGNLDFSRMQMFYIDYSWYGAGFIRWGLRSSDGKIQYVHKYLNNNINYQAYMRSGNLPGRYETNSFAKYSQLTSNIVPSSTTLQVANAVGFAPSGTLIVRSPDGSLQEYMSYSSVNTATGVFALTQRGSQSQGNSAISLTTTNASPIVTISSNTGLQPGQYIFAPGIAPQSAIYSVNATAIVMTAGAAASNTATGIIAPMGQTANLSFTASSAAPVIVEQHAPQYASEISHWGTSAIMDGGFTNDKAFVFQRAMSTPITIPVGNTYALMSLRVAPSASGSNPGLTVGTREIINRMQLILNTMDIYGAYPTYVQIVLNGQLSANAAAWTNVGGSSLAQYIFHSNNSPTIVSGGEVIFATYLNTVGGTNLTTTTVDLTPVRDLGTSILGGGYAASQIGVYPDGPDTITVVGTNLFTAPANTYVRLAWTEAQA
jgi:hypothetical protein